ncbi:hypothetical protein CC79DRAFT_655218 [Sarocladium strictum]
MARGGLVLVYSPRSPLRLDFNAQDRGRVVDSVGQVAEQSPSRKDGLILVSAGWVLHPCSCAALRIETTHHRRTLAGVSDDSSPPGVLTLFLSSLLLSSRFRLSLLSVPFFSSSEASCWLAVLRPSRRSRPLTLFFPSFSSTGFATAGLLITPFSTSNFRFRFRLSRRQLLSSSIQPASSLLDAGRQPLPILQERHRHRTTDGTTSKFEGGAPPQAKFIDLWFSPALTVITCSNPSRW